MVNYKTVDKEAMAEQVIEKSRFIGYIKPVETREEAEDFIRKIKSMHKGATHNVPAYVIGDKAQIQWASDDGEPSGTSGAPMLHMLTGEGITNVVIVVTRYFGGIKLGTGGLVRAYTGTARLTLEAAGLCEVRELDELSFSIDYTYYGRVQNMEQSGMFEAENTIFEDQIHMTVQAEPERTADILKALSEMTGGVCSSDNIRIEKKLGKKKI
jgi:uncharacterized YigZ family protein